MQDSDKEKEESNPRSTKDLTPSEKFFRHFQHEVSNIEALISNLGTITTSISERGDAIDNCLSAIALLNQEVKDASSYIPAHDQRTYGDGIKALSVKLQDARARFEPKKKFAFNKKPKANDIAQKNGIADSGSSSGTVAPGLPSSANETTNSKPNEALSSTSLSNISETSQHSSDTSTNLILFKEANKHIVLPISSSKANGSGTINTLTNCIVDMSGSGARTERHALQTLTLRNINYSLLICSRVHGAVHLTNLINTTLVISSRQFRMHNSRNCDVYLQTSSRPIIEDCSGIRFAPLPEIYRTGEDGGGGDEWQNVDDFKWLREEPSPNWGVLPAGERVSETVWREVVSGNSRVGLEEMLKAVAITG
jgi:tubulin-specific chaperone C